MNLFKTFEQYTSLTEEDYFTEAYVYLLRRFKEADRPLFNQLLRRLSSLDFSDEQNIELVTRESTESGRQPDVTIRTPTKLIYCEHKIGSPLSDNQLEHYQADLREQEVQYKQLVFISKKYEDTSGIQDLIEHRWFDIYDWLGELECKDLVNDFLRREFMKFMEGKQMAIKKVGEEMWSDTFRNGLADLQCLWALLKYVVEAENFKPEPEFSDTYAGFNFNKEEGSYYWIGVWYDHLEWLGFSGNGFTKQAVERLKKQYPHESEDEGLEGDGKEWIYSVTFEKLGFRQETTKEGQIRILRDFLRKQFDRFEAAR